MCGIVGYVGEGEALPYLLEGMSRLEYRGYDSAGVALLDGDRVVLYKRAGRLSNLTDLLGREEVPVSHLGIGHTRWATHGGVNHENAHPHSDCTGSVVVVHNGIIENFRELREELLAQGHDFRSATDSEVIAHLIEGYYHGNLLSAVRQAITRLRGSYALAALHKGEPHRLVGARQDSPLVVGLGDGVQYLASDIPAILGRTRQALILEDGEVADLNPDGVTVWNRLGEEVRREVFPITWDSEAAAKNGHPHFMLKEILEQPRAFRDTLRSRLTEDRVSISDRIPDSLLADIERVQVVACGTAYHAGLVGRRLLEEVAGIPVEGEVASEFRYRPLKSTGRTLLVVISQSGETADTLAALRAGKGMDMPTLAITNVLGSTIDREADFVLHTWAGPEVAVASTKAYTTQILVLVLLALRIAEVRRSLPEGELRILRRSLLSLPDLAEGFLEHAEDLRPLGEELARARDLFFIGRGLDYAVALEGQLKLKEITYLHAEALPAGELKHGTLALVEEGVPVIALATQRNLVEKTVSNIMEVKARGATVIGIAPADDDHLVGQVETLIRIPPVPDLLTPALSVLPLQLLAYYAAVARGTDVDRPRNLAKSVTVE